MKPLKHGSVNWKTYLPEGGIVDQKGRVTNAGVRLLSSQADFERNTTVQDLARLIGYIQEVLTRAAEPFKEGGEILLQVSLSKDAEPAFEMSFQGDLTTELLQRFYDSLSEIDARAEQSTVALQIHFVIKNA
ncbi:MAG TPA: hypothetical protein VGD45_16160 [Steroidobacter sp.]|uniref:hypothetical protein n=1 Tax=Steroidobacter sp. TaxID=1978227 RepID=UPI002EDA0F62